ncbi:hypothetical protein HHUSO_G18309 [Huso huso]|uniref:Uncharacterized protein n=1 Tax=Huso huso TaxID=61971 RepID=A0ABR0Z6V1_HUSHU
MNRTMRSSSPYRQPNMTFWSRSDPVIFPHVKTDHWSKMKNKVPTFMVSMPAAAFLGKGCGTGCMETVARYSYDSTGRLHPVQISDMSGILLKEPGRRIPGTSVSPSRGRVSPQKQPQYRNEFHDRAKRGFCYWPVENKVSKCSRYSFGAYKTALGLPSLKARG